MKSFKICVLSTLISTVLVGCGGSSGGDSSTTLQDDTQPVSYAFENVIEAFLNASIEYSTIVKDPKYASTLVHYYDKNGNLVDFKIPTETIGKNGCSAPALELNNREINSSGANFNIQPLSNNKRLVSVSSLPKSFINASFGKKICLYSDFSYSKNFIIGKSNQKIVELNNEESLLESSKALKLSDINRLINIKYQSSLKEGKLILKPYVSSVQNFADNEFIVNNNGEVKVFNTNTNKYSTLPGTKGKKWQYYSDKYIISKAHGGSVTVYDITSKRRVSLAAISVLQNTESNLQHIETATLSYGLWPIAGVALSGLPFKLVSENYSSETNLYFWQNAQWVKSTDFANQQPYQIILAGLNTATKKADYIDSNAYINIDNQYVAANNASNGGFDLVLGSISDFKVKPQKISDFSNYFNQLHIINGKFVVETSDKVLNNEHKSFYLIDNGQKKIIGSAGDNITMIKPSSHN
ncbi:hypothetical protein ACED51_08175 [Photobacterium swingsii]|uniref:hypothetical protein n=1 Tax=Photobacterium swingsii TaxID=680026 RepID=UPI00352DEC5C